MSRYALGDSEKMIVHILKYLLPGGDGFLVRGCECFVLRALGMRGRSISGVNTTSASPAVDLRRGIDENQLPCVGWVRRLHQKRQESGSRMGISREIKFAINSEWGELAPACYSSPPFCRPPPCRFQTLLLISSPRAGRPRF